VLKQGGYRSISEQRRLQEPHIGHKSITTKHDTTAASTSTHPTPQNPIKWSQLFLRYYKMIVNTQNITLADWAQKVDSIFPHFTHQRYGLPLLPFLISLPPYAFRTPAALLICSTESKTPTPPYESIGTVVRVLLPNAHTLVCRHIRVTVMTSWPRFGSWQEKGIFSV
jgi:hypothetical protein